MITYPDGSTAFNYTYASNGGVDLIKSGANTLVDYTYVGPQPTQRDISATNTIASTYAHDGLGRLTRLYSVVGANTRDDFTYGLDDRGNRLYRENNITSAKDELYKYDTLNRLTSADRGDLDGPKTGLSGAAVKYQDWDLDKVGNWELFWDDSATAETRLHNAVNEITKVDASAANLGYGAAGNMTRAPESGGSYYSYEYDHLNRVTAVADDNPTTIAEYQYDALGRRIETIDVANSVTKHCYYGQTPSGRLNWQLLETYKNSDSDVYEQFVWGGQYIDEIIRRQRDANTDGDFDDVGDDTLYYSQDGNWNVTALLDADGVALARYLYDAYGKPTVLEGDWTDDSPDDKDNEIRYAGYYYDAETANYHVRYRYYQPTLGRWLQRDPLGYVDTMSLYAYAQSNPINLFDPLGLDTDPECCDNCRATAFWARLKAKAKAVLDTAIATFTRDSIIADAKRKIQEAWDKFYEEEKRIDKEYQDAVHPVTGTIQIWYDAAVEAENKRHRAAEDRLFSPPMFPGPPVNFTLGNDHAYLEKIHYDALKALADKKSDKLDQARRHYDYQIEDARYRRNLTVYQQEVRQRDAKQAYKDEMERIKKELKEKLERIEAELKKCLEKCECCE